MNEDSELLRRYADERAEDALAEIVRRHVGLVYHAALRQTGDAALAEEVTQVVFADLARKAGGLAGRASITGWLYTSTRFAATKARRGEQRRRAREQEIFAMRALTHDSPAADWERLRPLIDEALHDLDERDREAVLLRFFEGRPLTEVGATLALSEDAARKRVARALDELQGLLARRGITSTAAALGLAMGAQAGAAVPTGLAASVTAGALSGGGLGYGMARVMGFMCAQKGLFVGAAVILLCGIGYGLHATKSPRKEKERQGVRLSDSVVGFGPNGENVRRSAVESAAEKNERVVRVLGEVTHPGLIPYGEGRTLTLLDALAQAGGFSRAADKRRVTLKRVNRDGESESTVIDVIELMKGQAKNVWLLESGDVIAVPRSATSVGGAQAGDVL